MKTFELEKKLEKLSLTNKTAYVYDEFMLKHLCSYDHVENPDRISSIYKHWEAKGLTDQMIRLEIVPLTKDEIAKTHSLKYLDDYEALIKSGKEESICGDIFLSAETVHAAYMSASGCNTLIETILSGKADNGFAVIRPPGHHCNGKAALGFCFINNVIVSANKAIEQKKASKIAIIDWDVHHGDGSELMTYERNDILYISLHRHDYGRFYPTTGKHTDIGKNEGVGFNLNIPFNNEIYGESFVGDDEYMLAFQNIILPVLKEFAPDLIIVSCGFDSCDNDQLGAQSLSQDTYGWMTNELLKIQSKLAIILEGGYLYDNLMKASEYCVRSLLGINENQRHEKKLKDGLFTCPRIAKELTEYAELFSKYWSNIETVFPSETGEVPYLEASEELRKSEELNGYLFESEKEYITFTEGKYIAVVVSGDPEKSTAVLKKHKYFKTKYWVLSHIAAKGEEVQDEFCYLISEDWTSINLNGFLKKEIQKSFKTQLNDLVLKLSNAKEFLIDCEVMVLKEEDKLTVKLNIMNEKKTTKFENSMLRGLLAFIKYSEQNML